MASFQSFGRVPSSSDFLKISSSGCAIIASHVSTVGENCLDQKLFGFVDVIALITFSSVMSMDSSGAS